MPTGSHLQHAVIEELSWEPSIVSAHVGVTAASGVATLTGHVENHAQKRAAEAAARRVKGVKAVAEEIEVRLPFETKRRDEDIAAAEIDRMGWDVSIPKDAVKVPVENGWVSLTGQVDSTCARMRRRWPRPRPGAAMPFSGRSQTMTSDLYSRPSPAPVLLSARTDA